MHGRMALSLFSFVAVFGILLVNMTDPYAGAMASPYYQSATPHLSAKAQKLLEVETAAYQSTEVTTRDAFTVTAKPAPPPPPAPAPAAPQGSGSASSGKSAAAPVAAASPGSAQAVAAQIVAAHGWGSEQFNCLVALWNKESGWRVNASNGSSGAYGIPQALPGNKMASVGADWQTNPATQITWGLNYITGRYGTPCGAWQHSVDMNWY
jgi:hypothetical protein